MNNIAMLIKKANSIGAFFQSMPNRNEALNGIADHLCKFWEPRMRRAFLAFLNENPQGKLDNVQLADIVLEAVSLHKESLKPLDEATT